MDIYYVILVLPAVLLALIAQGFVKSTFRKYNAVHSHRNITGAEAARQVLDAHGLTHVAVGKVAGDLTDHYDPRSNTIFLSTSTHDSTSVAAIGVAAHEAGHAIQHDVQYFPIQVRSAIIPATNIGSKLSVPLIILGLFLSSVAQDFILLAELGVICFGLSTLFQLVTCPVEFNASHRALETLKGTGMLDEDELPKARKVLSAAALTYVAALAVSAMQLLRFVLIVAGAKGGSKKRR